MNRRELMKTAVAASVTIASVGLAGPCEAAADSSAAGGAGKAGMDKRAFEAESRRIYAQHFAQTRETVATLKRKYAKPVFGKMRVWDLVEKLALCVDVSDYNLACTTQLIHTQQVVEGMEQDGIHDPDFFLAAITHDLGKVLLLAGEAPENVVCANTPIGEYAAGAGLDQVMLQWNHDEFLYSRLKDHLPEHVAWLVRYHSIVIEKTAPYMNEQDRRYSEKYLQPFRKYDLGTKSMWHLPPARLLDKYRDLIEKTFPVPIPI